MTQVNRTEWKIMQVAYFRMAPWLICCFIVTLFYIERKWLLMRNLTTILPLSQNFLENFSVLMLLMEVSKWWKIVGFLKKGFWLCSRSIFFTMLSELRFVKWVRFFERNCIVKRVSFFGQFFLALRLSDRKSEIKR